MRLLLIPFYRLARGELRCIGATTLTEYRKHVEKEPAFERRFQQVYVSEPSVNDTISILRGLKEKYETHHGVRITDNALVLAAQLSSRYITNRFLPDKAIDLIDEACANTRVQLDSQPEAIDQLERRRLQLEVEATALAKEDDDVSLVYCCLSLVTNVLILGEQAKIDCSQSRVGEDQRRTTTTQTQIRRRKEQIKSNTRFEEKARTAEG